MALSRALEGVLGPRDPRGRLLLYGFLVAGLVVVGVVVAEKIADAVFEREMRGAEDVLLGRVAGDRAEAANVLGRLIFFEIADPHDPHPDRASLLLDTALPALRAGLKAPEAGARVGCAQALRSLGPLAVEALPELTAIVRATDPSERVENSVADALGRIGPPALQTLVEGLRSSSRTLRMWCAYGLAWLGPDAVTAHGALLLTFLSDPTPRIREAGAAALARAGAGSRAALRAFVPLFTDEDQSVRLHSMIYVRQIGVDRETARAIVRAAEKEAVADVRASAFSALETLDPADAAEVIPALTAGLTDSDGQVRRAATTSLHALAARSAK